MNVEKLRLLIDENVRLAQGRVDAFKAEVAKNPYHALVWSGQIFVATAILDVMGPFQEAIKADDVQYDGLYVRLLERVMYSAKSIENSTSPQSVYMDRCILAARARLAEIVKECDE